MSGVKATVFRARLIGTGEALRLKATLIVNGVTLRLYELIAAAPEHRVDTGRMRAGWAIAAEVAGDYAPAAVTPEQRRARKAGERLFDLPSSSSFLVAIANAPLEAKRVIFNNVEYAVWVELGSDRMEGQHVVNLAVQRLVAGPPSVASMVA